jgi:cation:H+ antiporter
MNDYVALAVGVVCAGIGGELFVRGVVGIAHWARVSAGIIGATVAAFATSSPELSVAISSALAKKPEISLGDALGSNVVNVALILAIPVLISGIKSAPDSVSRELPVALFAPMLTVILALDGVLSRIDGVVLLCVFIIWLTSITLEVRKQRSAAEKVLGEQRGWLAMILCVIGLLFLVAAGHFIVTGAKGIALAFGIPAFVIGATIVAIGTSVPELATTIIAKIRKHDEVGLGTILGSNIFNGLLIIAVAAIIYPIKIALHEVMLALMFGIIVMILIVPMRDGHIGRGRGLLLLGLYVVYVVMMLEQ